MQEWEYCYIYTGGEEFIVHYSNDPGIQEEASEEYIIFLLSRLGNEGWELITVTEHALGDRYWFKRPKQ